jgi:hypothetical protein
MTKRRWTVREATPADRADQARLFNTCFRKDKGADTFVWKYDSNPHGPAVSRVACDEQGAIVGGYSYMPRRFLRDGEPIVLMQASDAMTMPDWRGQGIFTGLDDIVCEACGDAGVPLTWAYSGRLSLKGFLRNGWKLIGYAPIWRYRFRSRRGLLRLGRVGPLAASIAPLLDVFLGWRDKSRFPSRGADTELVRIDRFEPDVDALFARCAPRTGLVGERSAEWLNWRYVDNPSRRQQCFGWMRDGELAGYLVVEFREGHAWLVDHMAADEDVRRALLHGFTAAAHAEGLEEVTALQFEHDPAVRPLLSLGYRRARGELPFRARFPFIVRTCRADAPGEDLDMARWRLADGDRDAEHMSS